MNNQLLEILTSFLEKHCKTLISYFTSPKITTPFKLNKNLEPKDISEVSIPNELKPKYDSRAIKQIKSRKLREATLEFANLMLEVFPKNALDNFYNNISTLKIKRNILILFESAEGIYYSTANTICVVNLTAVFHELLHMASTYYNKTAQIVYIGFKQTSRFSTRGGGINEGYTELLAERYFGKKHKIFKPYKFEVFIAEKLEQIVGRKKMEFLYLTADLLGLIKELTNYINLNKVMDFINNLDSISPNVNDPISSINLSIQKTKIEIYKFLIKIYEAKLKEQLAMELININEYNSKYREFIQSFNGKIKLENYDLLEEKNNESIKRA